MVVHFGEQECGTLVKALTNVLRVRVPVDHIIFGLILLLVLALVPKRLFSGNFGFLLSSRIVISKIPFRSGICQMKGHSGDVLSLKSYLSFTFLLLLVFALSPRGFTPRSFCFSSPSKRFKISRHPKLNPYCG